MSEEISIVLPLSAIAGASTLAPSEIVRALQNSVRMKAEIDAAEKRVENLKKLLALAGRNMTLILDEVNDPFEKAQALRKLSKELQDIAASEAGTK